MRPVREMFEVGSALTPAVFDVTDGQRTHFQSIHCVSVRYAW